MSYREIYESWLHDEYFDEEFRRELAQLTDEKEIEDRFYKDLEFGTGGMRGVLGAGRNRINAYVLRKANQGFANFLNRRYETLLREGKEGLEKAIAIAYDSRRMSKEFMMVSAGVMAANGIKCYVFDGVRTTPQLSFTVRRKQCIGGIMITASHNPPNYNGYKVYEETGCQLVPDLADQLVEDVSKVAFSDVRFMDFEEAVRDGHIVYLSPEEDDRYIEMVSQVSLNPDLLKKSRLKVVYTPLHGTGGKSVVKMTEKMGFQGLIPVVEQFEPDGEFPTTSKPNPEEAVAFEVAKRYMTEHDADLAIATDPDCDRLGILTRKGTLLTGNQIGTLYLEYLLSQKKGITKDHYVVNTIVSSDLAKAQAEYYGVKIYQTLTGFKFIGEIIEKDPAHFIMGYEESYGYNFDQHVRDKDAVQATLLAIELTEFFGTDLEAVLNEIYRRHGYFVEVTESIAFEGKEGSVLMAKCMETFRNASFAYDRKMDYSKDETGLPKSDVLKFYLGKSTWFVLRPSGTEPKLKVYYSVNGVDEESTKQTLSDLKNMVKSYM